MGFGIMVGCETAGDQKAGTEAKVRPKATPMQGERREQVVERFHATGGF